MQTSSFGVKVVGYMGEAGYMAQYQARDELGTRYGIGSGSALRITGDVE